MNFIHSKKQLNKGDVVELACDSTCNFMLTDDRNFSSYKKGELFGYYGGHFTDFPARITTPHSGQWNIIIDSPNGGPIDSYSIRIIG
ncbi:MAG: DUF1883 domain-containing protein [Geobacteraceae bacterium]|nr:DUF1883 domain-containing protein [Geobacteraceae bacterium]